MGDNAARALWLSVKETALGFWPLWLGFAFAWPVRYIPRSSVFAEACQDYGVYQLLGTALTLLAAFAASGFLARVLSKKVIVRSGCAAGLVGSLSFVLIGGVQSGPAVLVGYLLIGCVNAVFLLLWFTAFVGRGVARSMACLALSALVLPLIDGFLLLFPDGVLAHLMVLMPLVSPLLLARCFREHDLAFFQESRKRQPGTAAGYLVLAVVVGCAFGLMSGLVGGVPSRGADYLLVGTLFIQGVALALSAPLVERKGFHSVLTRFALPIIAAAYLVLPIAQWPPSVTNAMCITGFFYVYFAMVAFFASQRLEARRALRSFLLFYLLLAASEFISSFVIGRFVNEELPSTMLFTIALVAIYLFFLVSNAIERSRPDRNLDLSLGEQAYREALEAQVATFDLTDREKQILVLIAAGKPRKAIAAELFISEDTVKSHTRNMYRKLGIHSRSDVKALLEKSSPL